jgi:hypothetical protein
MIKQSLTVTASLAVLIVVAATSVLFVLTSLAGQRSGLRHGCPALSPSAARHAASSGYGRQLARLAACGARVG